MQNRAPFAEVSQSVAATNYEPRVVAFLDVLGFSALVQRADQDVEVRNRLTGLLNAGKDLAASNMRERDLKVQNFSDSFIVSASNSWEGLKAIFEFCEQIALGFMTIGAAVRGGITVGNAFHDTSIVYGPGVLRAYHLENSVARVPRIVLDHSALGLARAHVDEFPSPDVSRKSAVLYRDDGDGVVYFNILRRFGHLVVPHEDMSNAFSDDDIQRLEKIRKFIQSSIDEHIDNPDVYVKFRWLAIYWNTFVGVHYTNVGAKNIGWVALGSQVWTDK